jgi:hypothetical protein
MSRKKMTTITKLISIRELKEYVSLYNEGLVTWQDIANDIIRNHNKPISARQVKALAKRQSLIPIEVCTRAHLKENVAYSSSNQKYQIIKSNYFRKQNVFFVKLENNHHLLNLGLSRKNRLWVLYHVYILWLHYPDKITDLHQSRVKKGHIISEESTDNIIVKVW